MEDKAMPRKIFKEGKKYTFSDYFDMGNPVEEIVAELGYSFASRIVALPRSMDFDGKLVEDLQASYYGLLSKVSLNSEAAKREFMIAPVLLALINIIDAKLNIEYPLDIDDRLGGTVDYLLRSRSELIVIEAKKGDLERGFNQLAAEMIAVDCYEDVDAFPVLYGAITIGEIWRFASLDRKAKHLTKDAHTFRFPEDLQEIFAILKGVLGAS
jgi:hypothetical protein